MSDLMRWCVTHRSVMAELPFNDSRCYRFLVIPSWQEREAECEPVLVEWPVLLKEADDE